METNMMLKATRAAKVLTGMALAVAATIASADDATPAAAAPAMAAPTASLLAVKLAPETAHRLENKWCSACHGYNGRSVQPTFPMLAGQSAEYIATQLKYFHNLTQDDRAVTHETMFEQWIINVTGLRRSYRYDDAPRNEPRAWDFMKGVARDLDEPTMQSLGEYFSKQAPLAGRPSHRGDVARGKTLYLEGDAEKGLIACQSCHGPDAHGQGPIPRLAGQHADYVKLQLQYIKSGVRSVDQMQALIANLTDADFEAVAAYVQSLD
jgi:cytochrome c553